MSKGVTFLLSNALAEPLRAAATGSALFLVRDSISQAISLIIRIPRLCG